MIFPLICLLLSITAGMLAIERYAGIAQLAPRWAAHTFALGSGTALGIGASAILYWLLSVLLSAGRWEPIAELAALGWLARTYWRANRTSAPLHDAPPSAPARFPGAILALIGIGAALAIVTAAMNLYWNGNPYGGWDAWSIWNLRAKFLAEGLPARAWTAQLAATTHPEYPLLLSSAVARCWNCGASLAPAAPAAISYAFFLSVVATAVGGMSILRGPAAGLLAGLILVCSPALAAEVPAQYADVPLSAYFTCALVSALLDRPVWSGVFAGLAAWTKDEGVLFCGVLLVAFAAFRCRDLLRCGLGILPTAVLAAGFKLLLAPHISSQFAGAMASRFFDPGRYGLLFGALLKSSLALGAGWYHPVLPVIGYAAAVRFRVRPEARDGRLLGLFVIAAMLGGYCAVLIATPNDLHWQLGTALGRLLVQWWPLAVVCAMFWLRSPEEFAPAPATGAARKRKR